MAKQPIVVTLLAGFKGDGLKQAQKQQEEAEAAAEA